MSRRSSSWLVALVACVAAQAEARPLHGTVFADRDGDGRRAPDEPGVANAVVAYGSARFTTTDASGRYQLDVPDAARGIVWARVPDGFVPGPAWERDRGSGDADLALRPLATPHRGPLTFVAAADTHLTAGQPFFGDLGRAVDDATALEPRPAFFTILGDVTQNNQPAEFALLDHALAGLDVPYVPVPGNHDWYDGGAAWFAHYGPDNYSFDIGTTHFVVWNMAMALDELEAYLGAELARVAPAMTIVALTHAPPTPEVVRVLEQLGVDYVLTGHTHSNRVVDHGGLLELTTQPLLMGGLDFTPAGYRVITLDDGRLSAFHRTVIDPVLEVTAPATGACVPPDAELIVAAELDAGALAVTARFDCGTPVALTLAGGWSWRAALPGLAPGPHAVLVEARSSSGARRTRTHAFEVCAAPPAAPSGAGWPQLGGDAAHTGAIARELVPPLAPRWTVRAGGHVLTGAPVIDRGTVYVVTADLADGRGGAIVALDLATGAQRWRAPSVLPIRGGAVVTGDTVVASQLDGTVLGLDAQTGAIRWRYELLGVEPRGAATFATPVADAGEVLIGNQRHVAAIDAATGAARWARDPMRRHQDFPSMAAIAVDEGIAVGVFDRELGGVFAWDRVDARLLWHYVEGARANSINASPVIADGTVYLVNGATEVLALELATGALRWITKLDPTGYEWNIASLGAPAIADGVLVVPSLAGELVALETAAGGILWRAAGTPTALRATHYRGEGERGFASSPVITGSLVWSVDTAGVVTARELQAGTALWRHELRVPVLASPAVSGDWLVVASYDGSVHALARTGVTRAPLPRAATCEPPRTGGCCETGASSHAGLAAIVLGLQRRRRRRSASNASPSGNADAAPPALHV